MFQTCQGHTEGEVSVTYVIITSHNEPLLVLIEAKLQAKQIHS